MTSRDVWKDCRARGQAYPASIDSTTTGEPGAAGTSEPQSKAAQQSTESTALQWVRSTDGGMQLHSSGTGSRRSQRERCSHNRSLAFLSCAKLPVYSPPPPIEQQREALVTASVPTGGSSPAGRAAGSERPGLALLFPAEVSVLLPPASLQRGPCPAQSCRLQPFLLSLQLVLFLTSSAPAFSLGTCDSATDTQILRGIASHHFKITARGTGWGHESKARGAAGTSTACCVLQASKAHC